MKFVGEILKNNRESRKITLKDVSRELKISEEILKNIENNHFQNDIDIVFIIGHLRSYCSFLDLNHIELVDKFKKENLTKEKDKIEIERPKFEYRLLFSNKILSLSLIVVIFVTFYFLFIEVDKPLREYAIIPDLPENYISIVEEAGVVKIDKNKNINISKVENFAKLESTPNLSSAIASSPKIVEEKSILITLKFLDDTWVQLRDENDEIIFSQLMNKNDEYSYDLDTNYSITSGNAGHILVLINQKVRGKIGKKGQVVDSLVLNKDFSN
jgi:cytoskeletal protein RodZ